jgi:hypothetical protein
MGTCLEACLASTPNLAALLRKGNVEAVRAFLADSANEKPLTFGTGTLLHLAAQGGSVPVLELVWQHLKDTWEERTATFQRRSNPFQRISGSSQALAQEGTLHEYLNLPNAKGVSALMEAIRSGHSAAATFLLDQVRAVQGPGLFAKAFGFNAT